MRARCIVESVNGTGPFQVVARALAEDGDVTEPLPGVAAVWVRFTVDAGSTDFGEGDVFHVDISEPERPERPQVEAQVEEAIPEPVQQTVAEEPEPEPEPAPKKARARKKA